MPNQTKPTQAHAHDIQTSPAASTKFVSSDTQGVTRIKF